MSPDARRISQTIRAMPGAVAAFAGDPANLPKWAAGLSLGIRNEDGRWLTDSPTGEVEVRFVGDVADGVLDHDVVFPDGSVTRNPLRVTARDGGSEIVFTVAREAGVTDEAYARDCAAVAADLARLRDLLESA
ncbi:polyketide cyclase [Gulosibacter faecalis]|uniref:SRPBCC family protein n=1 Tax=Gulosibacter faecalis TaxID=272240 RepID=A0ABW5UZV1_9MICO|nr:polyketide cyclase [Gulosibacter faecalis]